MGNRLFKSRNGSYNQASYELTQPTEDSEAAKAHIRIRKDFSIKKAQVAMEVRTSKVQSANLALEFDVGNEVRITGMTVIGNRLLLCDNRAKSLLVYRTSGQYKQTVSLLSYPFDLTVLSNEHTTAVAFEREHFIQFLEIFVTDIVAGCKMRIVRPCTGAITSYKENIVICTNETIDIYSTGGDLLRTKPLYHSQLNPYCMKCSVKYFAFSNGKSLFIYDFKLLNYKSVQLMSPCALATDRSDNIYCTDVAKDILYVYSIKEERFTELRTSKHGLYSPRAICLNAKFSKIYISNNNGQSIYMYSL